MESIKVFLVNPYTGIASILDVEAEVIGKIGVHLDVSGVVAGTKYNLTHIPTGYAIRSGLDTKEEAIDLAKKVKKLSAFPGEFGVRPPDEKLDPLRLKLEEILKRPLVIDRRKLRKITY
jgi:hypothetical protein